MDRILFRTCTTIKVVETTQYCTAASTRKKICNRSSVRKVRLQAVALLKKGKSAGVDYIQAELVQAGGETMIAVLEEICNRI